jgi:hypothetical protein
MHFLLFFVVLVYKAPIIKLYQLVRFIQVILDTEEYMSLKYNIDIKCIKHLNAIYINFLNAYLKMSYYIISIAY